jgi:hypothetical protein
VIRHAPSSGGAHESNDHPKETQDKMKYLYAAKEIKQRHSQA